MSNSLPPMTEYVGIKMISACPMTLRQAKSEYGVKVGDSSTADHNDEGYLVRYKDGYVSWSPKAVFDAAHQPTSGMSYEMAVTVASVGAKVSRSKWTDGRYFALGNDEDGVKTYRLHTRQGVQDFDIDELNMIAADYYVVE